MNYKVLDTNRVTSRVYEEYGEGQYNYWYDEEKTFYFMNTAYWAELDEAKVLFSTEDFDDILPFLRKELKADIAAECVNKHTPRLRRALRNLYGEPKATIADCINIRERLLEVIYLRGRSEALGRDIEEIL